MMERVKKIANAVVLAGPGVTIHGVGVPLVLDDAHLFVQLREPVQLNTNFFLNSVSILL